MQTMNISLPDPMKQYVEDQVAAGAYSSASEYVRELVRIDQKRYAKEMLERTLVAAMNEGDAVEVNEAWWANLREDFRKRRATRKEKNEL
jgi:antitoxin ParD1/3/4